MADEPVKREAEGDSWQVIPWVYGENLDNNTLKQECCDVEMRYFRVFGVLIPSVDTKDSTICDSFVAPPQQSQDGGSK